jgi:hypothetical protein
MSGDGEVDSHQRYSVAHGDLVGMLGRREFVVGGTWALMPSFASAAELLATSGSQAVDLSEQSARVLLQPQREHLFAYLQEAGSRRITLVCRGLSARKAPGTSFLLFLNAEEGASLNSEDVGFLGALSFFGGASRDGELQWPTVSFEVSTAIQGMKRVGKLKPPLSITFVGAREPERDSNPKVQQIDLFSS